LSSLKGLEAPRCRKADKAGCVPTLLDESLASIALLDPPPGVPTAVIVVSFEGGSAKRDLGGAEIGPDLSVT